MYDHADLRASHRAVEAVLCCIVGKWIRQTALQSRWAARRVCDTAIECISRVLMSVPRMRIYHCAQNNTAVTDLNLSGCALGDEEVALLAVAMRSNRSITRLDISRNRMTDEGMTALASALEVSAGSPKQARSLRESICSVLHS